MSEAKRWWFAVCCLALFLLSGGPASAGTLDADWLNRMVEKCAACHSTDGAMHKDAFPRIKGQKKKYLEKQLYAFRDIIVEDLKSFKLSTRSDHVMDFVSSPMGDTAVTALASYFSRLKCEANQIPTISYIPNIPCAQCHGEKGISAVNDVPNLAGQSREYMIAQLLALKEGTLVKNKPRFKKSSLSLDSVMLRYHRDMGRWANKLNDDDIVAAASYYSALACR
ncbi:MAG: c-type cytochrome [Rhodospirillales bacterium]|nr:c-type cytochrome [Rhodospirillales bacterium]